MEINSFVDKYIRDFKAALDGIETHIGADTASFQVGVAKAVEWVQEVQRSNNKIFFLGNGGSAGIASHQAVDYWKNGKVRATAFNDASLLTCISNDLGYENVFSAPLERFADKGDLAICISSSGGSVNILNAAKMAREKGCKVITLSGFKTDNPLRALGDINFFVPAFSYGYVEILHEFISHTILDTKMYTQDGIDIFFRNQPLKKQV